MLFVPLKILFCPMILPLVVFAGGFAAFRMATPGCERIPADAHIFVLTGDARRIPFALDLLNSHPKRRLYVIGAGTPNFGGRHADRIEIESRSKSTFENALAIRYLARERGLREITVITTIDHMNRAAFLTKRQLEDVRVSACSVPLNGMPAARRLERWVLEYIKFIGTIFGIQSRA